MTPPETEGLCELFSFLWLTHYIEQKDAPQERTEEARRLIEKMKNNPDPTYGEGFRKVRCTFETAALPLIDFMKMVRKNKHVL
jgi:hypothetical protein